MINDFHDSSICQQVLNAVFGHMIKIEMIVQDPRSIRFGVILQGNHTFVIVKVLAGKFLIAEAGLIEDILPGSEYKFFPFLPGNMPQERQQFFACLLYTSRCV